MLLVIAPDATRRAALARAAGTAASEASALLVAKAVRESRPDALVIEAESAEAVRSLLGRARAAAETSLSAVLVVPDGSAWLRGALPRELQPCVVVASTEAIEVLAAAVAGLDGWVATGPSGAARGPRAGLQWVADRREVRGPADTAQLTGSEARIFALLFAAGGRIVGHEALTRELWGEVIVDGHTRASIRAHVYTLRRKLAAVGCAGVVLSLPGAGYRLDADQVNRR